MPRPHGRGLRPARRDRLPFPEVEPRGRGVRIASHELFEQAPRFFRAVVVPGNGRSHLAGVALGHPVEVLGGQATQSSCFVGLPHEVSQQGEVQVGESKAGIKANASSNHRFGGADVLRRFDAQGEQPICLHRARAQLADGPHGVRRAHIEAAADSRRQIVRERERIASAHGVGEHDTAAGEILDARVDADLVGGADDGPVDDNRCAGAPDRVQPPGRVDRRELRRPDLTSRLVQSIDRDHFDLRVLRQPGHEHGWQSGRQPGGVLGATQILEAHDGERGPAGRRRQHRG